MRTSTVLEVCVVSDTDKTEHWIASQNAINVKEDEEQDGGVTIDWKRM